MTETFFQSELILLNILNHQDKSGKHLQSTNIFKGSNKKLKIENKKLEILVTTLIFILMKQKVQV